MALIRFTFGTTVNGAQYDRLLDLRFADQINWASALSKISDEVYADTKTNLLQRGKLAGGWAPLSPEYQRQKTADYKAGRIKYNKIMFRTGRLAASLMDKTSPEAINKIEATSPVKRLSVGTAVPYAIWHEVGTRRMPRRQLVALSAARRQRITRIFQIEALAAAGRIGRQSRTGQAT